MTAVVGILNKQSVALAADSAVTITGPHGRKILNKANKLFALSKCHPIGVMLYNSASFMGVPWETIIKVYRRQLGSKAFPTVRAWQEDFLNFIRAKDWFTPDDIKEAFSAAFFRHVIILAINDADQKNPVLFADVSDQTKQNEIIAALLQIIAEMRTYFEKQPICPELINLDLMPIKG